MRGAFVAERCDLPVGVADLGVVLGENAFGKVITDQQSGLLVVLLDEDVDVLVGDRDAVTFDVHVRFLAVLPRIRDERHQVPAHAAQ
ncbi:hypothetical protein [Solirubrobacter pauli]|uniref:hypothetical protein n=1 Tax=Solirubrobacter pauli TaxID=166793 RepID=UPI000EB2567C|nr:hypothetical protein [Solirubrobacter pauli]